jgi:hypothetical protein
MKSKITILLSVLFLLPTLAMASTQDASLFSTSAPQLAAERAWLDCTGPFSEYVSCDVPYSGSTVGKSDTADTYSCAGSPTLDGPEVSHILVLATSADLTATITTTHNLDVLILNACDTTSCVAWGDTTCTYNVAPVGTYYIIVDGVSGDAGDYTLTVSCNYYGTPIYTPTPTTSAVPATTSAGILILVLGMTLILGLLTWKFSAAKL